MSGQAIDFEFKLDEGEFAKLKQKLNELSGGQANKYIARALNKTVTSARVKLAGKAQESYTVKSGGFKKDARIKNATAGHLVAYINSEGSTLNVHYFKWSRNGGSHGVKIDVVRSGLKEMHLNGNKAFVVQQLRRSRAQGGKGGVANLVFARPGKERTPIYIMKSKSVPYMLGNDQRVWSPTRPQIESDLRKYMEQQIAFLLK